MHCMHLSALRACIKYALPFRVVRMWHLLFSLMLIGLAKTFNQNHIILS